MQLVKKTRKEWRCNKCLDIIPEGSSMFRECLNKWETKIYCIKCKKSVIEKELETWTKGIKNFEKDNNPNSAYNVFKDNAKVCQEMLNYINHI